jgi:outer membrane receptor for ferrienterochelin and colicins
MKNNNTRFALSIIAVAVAQILAHANAQSTEEPKPEPVQEQKPEQKSADKPAVKPADKKADEKSEPAKKEKIEVTGKQGAYDARRDDTATKIVITQEEIQKFGDTQLSDVFKRLPGVTGGGGRGGGGGPRMRGMGGGFTQVLLNGEPAPRGFSLETIDPKIVERIEVIRAATAEFSTQAIAGTINIVLKEKISFQQKEFRLGGNTSKNGSGFNMGGQYSDKIDNLSYQIGGFASVTDFDSQSESARRAVAGQSYLYERASKGDNGGRTKNLGLSPRVIYSLGTGNSLTWQMFANVYETKSKSMSDEVLSIGLPNPFPVTRGNFDNEGYFARTDLNWIQRFEGGSKIDTKIGINSFGNESTSDNRSFTLTGSPVLDSEVKSRIKETSFSFTGKYSRPLGEDHSFVAGWDTSTSDRDDDQAQRYRLAARPVTPFDDKSQIKVNRVAVFAQDEWNVTKNWSVYAGVRWEQIRTESAGTYTGVDIETAVNTSRVTSPIIQTLYKLPELKGHQLRFAITRTYRAPAANLLSARRFLSDDNSPTSPDSIGNPKLKPELATGLDATYEIFFPAGGLMSLTASTRKITDYNRTDTFLDTSVQNPRWVRTTINSGKASSSSLEFDAKLPLQLIWKDAPGIEARFNLNKNWSKVDTVPGPNNRLNEQTPMSASLGLDWRVKEVPLTTGASFSWRNQGFVRTDVDQTFYSNVVRDLDAYAMWRFSPKSSMRLSISNALAQDRKSESTVLTRDGYFQTESKSKSAMRINLGFEFKF